MPLNTTSDRAREIAISLDDKEYCEAFVSAEIASTIPFQLRAMRKRRELTQTELAQLLGKKQKTISDFENPNYARYTLTSLKQLAAFFDVGLIVRFAPYSELVDWAARLSKKQIDVQERAKDTRLRRQRNGKSGDETTSSALAGGIATDSTSGRVLHFPTSETRAKWVQVKRSESAITPLAEARVR